MSREPMQDFRFDRSPYERPNQPWVCGRLAAGRPCPLGPDARGRCVASGECVPVREGDRWHCARPAALGGPCADGPRPDGACAPPIVPCQPVRSIRGRRAALSRSVAAGTLGVLLALFGGAWPRTALVEPGPVSILHGSFGEDCARCHGPAAAGGLGAWVDAALGRSPRADQSGLCLVCHKLGADARLPHARPRAELEARRGAAAPFDANEEPLRLRLAADLVGTPHGPVGEVACSACHVEHRGGFESLTRIDDDRCQVCHVQRFDGFADGHPEFAGYPYARRTRIAFDHGTHLRDHFLRPERRERAPATCGACHEINAAGRSMRTRGFEAACAGCHEDAIREEVAFLRLPAAHLAKLDGIGVWPADSTDEAFDGVTTPFMIPLLEADPDPAPPPAADIRVLDDAPEAERAAAAGYVRAVKRLLAELVGAGSTGPGRDALRARLDRLAGSPGLDDGTATALLRELPGEALRAMADAWLPGLLAEPASAPSRTPRIDPAAVAGHTWIANGRWTLDPLDLSIRYRPLRHADPLFRAWVELAARAGDGQPALASILAAEGGRCIKCHSLERAGGGTSITVNWTALRPDERADGFTRFAHASHLKLSRTEACAGCHVLAPDPERGVQASFRGDGGEPRLDPGQFRSAFAPMTRAMCTGCHAPGHGPTRCTDCHGYHVGSFVRR